MQDCTFATIPSRGPLLSYVDFDGNVDILYTVDVGVGTPAQQFNIVPDSERTPLSSGHYSNRDQPDPRTFGCRITRPTIQ
jgi:hypothetical protein